MPIAPAFSPRHIGPSVSETSAMLKSLGLSSLEELADQVVPEEIRLRGDLSLPEPLTEEKALKRLRQLMDRNKVLRSFNGASFIL